MAATLIGQSIVFCSKIEADEKGDVQSLLGLYGVIACDKFPAEEEVNVFVSVTGMIGENKLQLRMAKAGTNKFHVVNTVICNHKSLDEVRQLNFKNEMRFARAGTYIFEVHVNDAAVLRKLLYVKSRD